MSIDVTDAEPVQCVSSDQVQDFLVCGHTRLRQILQRIQHKLATAEIAQRKLAKDKRMQENTPGVEAARQVPCRCFADAGSQTDVSTRITVILGAAA